MKKHKTRVSPKFLVTQRLDPDYYHPQHLEDEAQLQEFGAEALGTAGHFFVGPFGSKLPSSLYLDKGVPLFRISNIGAMQVEFEGMAHLAPAVHRELSASKVIPGDLLIVKASVGEKLCKVPETIPQANITQQIIALRPNNRFDTDYIAAFLFCEYGREEVLSLPVPQIILNNSEKILHCTNLRETALRSAERLTTAAKLLVEALIEGNITELDLQEAQKAIQQGDYILDRQILSRLTRKGILHRGEKTNEPPLFPDLDALYRVLSDDNDTADNSDWDSASKSRQRWRSPIQLLPRAAEASTSYRADDSAVTLLDKEVY